MNRAAHMVGSMIVEPLEWVREQGIVLQSARGPIPNLAEYVAGEPIPGSWSRTASPGNAWLPSTRNTLPRAPTEPPRSPFPNGSLPKKSPPRGSSLSTTRWHNCQPASGDQGGWTKPAMAALVGVVAHGCWDQIIGDLRASAGYESPARAYPLAGQSGR
jgi:hypothetical protein